MKIAISGSHGMVGDYVRNKLKGEGHDVVRILRRRRGDRAPDIYMSMREGTVDMRKFEGQQAVIHLAGSPIVGKRWNRERKAEIYESRVNGTRILCEAIAKVKRRPRILLCASAVGYYGNRGDEVLDESSESGEGFSGPGVPGLGSCRTTRPGRRRTGGKHALRDHPEYGGRRSGQDAARIQARYRRTPGFGPNITCPGSVCRTCTTSFPICSTTTACTAR